VGNDYFSCNSNEKVYISIKRKTVKLGSNTYSYNAIYYNNIM